MSNVISLCDNQPTGERQIVPEAVEGIRKLLEMAESGELVGFAAALQYFDNTAGEYAGGLIGGYRMAGAAHCMALKIARICDEDA